MIYAVFGDWSEGVSVVKEVGDGIGALGGMWQW